MRYRAFGQTGLSVSEIGFGCGPTAGLMLSDDAAFRRDAVAYALEQGINYFDTAAAYGQGRSERNLGQALAELSAKPIVSTKVTLEWPDLENIPVAVECSVRESLARLRVERLDIVHLHNRVGSARAARSPYGSGALISIEDALGAQGVAETFRRLQENGLIGVGGCCAFGGEADAVAAIIDSDAFASVIVNYSVLNATAWQSPPAAPIPDYSGVGARAARRGMAVVALRILEGGVLAGFDYLNAGTEQNPERRADFQRVGALDFARENEEDSVPMAIRFALSNPDVSTALVGFSDEHQITQALEYAGRGPYKPEILAKIEALRVKDFGRT